MNTLKFKTILVAFALIALAACGKKDGSAQVNIPRGDGPRTDNPVPANSGQMVGIVFADNQYQQQFQEAVVGFLSTDVKPEYVGYVSATGQNGSGVRFGGKVSLSTGALRPPYNVNATINSSSTFVIQVIDYIPQDPSAKLIPAIALGSATGTINGNQVTIMFSDNYGAVQLQGTLNSSNNNFEGIIKYDNYVTVDGARPGAAGTLGNFRIQICSFFACN